MILRTAGHIFGREPSNDYLIKILFLLSKWFQSRRFLWEFPLGSYVKLSSADNDELFNMYYRTFYELWTFAHFDRLCKLEKRGDEILKKSSSETTGIISTKLCWNAHHYAYTVQIWAHSGLK
jgi:hypothetical protein